MAQLARLEKNQWVHFEEFTTGTNSQIRDNIYTPFQHTDVVDPFLSRGTFTTLGLSSLMESSSSITQELITLNHNWFLEKRAYLELIKPEFHPHLDYIFLIVKSALSKLPSISQAYVELTYDECISISLTVQEFRVFIEIDLSEYLPNFEDLDTRAAIFYSDKSESLPAYSDNLRNLDTYLLNSILPNHHLLFDLLATK